MVIRSLSYSTLLHVLSFNSSIQHKSEYIVVKTPDNSRYYWGNFLFFHHPPKQDSMSEWEFLFDKEFSGMAINHKAFAWDSVSEEYGKVDAFIENGYYFEFDDVLMARDLFKPKYYNPDLTIKSIRSTNQWEQVCQLNLDCYKDDLDVNYMGHVKILMQDYIKQVEQGQGIWMGAFTGGQIVGDMGLFKAGGESGLILSVKTNPDYRAKGVCRTLLYHSTLLGFKHFGFKEILMVADKELSVEKIYRSVGFYCCEQGVSLLKIN